MKQKKFIAILTTLAMILSLGSGVTMFQKVLAAGYNLTNPTTGSNGVTTWDCIYFGNYYQSDSTGTTKDPIKWRVLSVDGDDAFLLADKNLDAKAYNMSYTNVTWENCTLRSWLNGYGAHSNVENTDYRSDNFIDTAFTEAEQNAILQTNVINEDNPYYGTEGGNNTIDQVYLLSITEASNTYYGFNSMFDTLSETRKAKNTSYANKQGAWASASMEDMGNGEWWLRSPGYYRSNASDVLPNGRGYHSSHVLSNTGIAVRPALHLNLSASNLWSYAGTVSAQGGSPTTNTPSITPTDVSTGGGTGDLKNPVTDSSNGVTTWDCVYFGNYWQKDTNGDGVADENDKKQPIKWRVLSVDEEDAFLMADQNLDAKPYNTSYTDVTWDTCTLRSWLNGYGASYNGENTDYSNDNFIDTAFTEVEQYSILHTNVINEDNPYYGTDGGDNTTDQIYLLSVAEASNASYGFNSKYDTPSKTRVSTNTAYTAEKGEEYSADVADIWWLRSPGYDSIGASSVYDDGYGYVFSDIHYDYVAVRPVLHLNLSASNLWSYAGTVSSEGESQPMGSEAPLPSLMPPADSTNSPVATMTEIPKVSANPSETPVGEVTANLKNPVIDSNGVTTWYCVYFGNYWQEDINGDGVADENDEKQPIKWRVLSVDGEDAFLLADQNLDAKPYNTLYTDVTWENCTLRSWLNGYGASANVENTDYSNDNFIDVAFTEAERNAIRQTNVINEDNSHYDTEGGNNTTDQVYLLSLADVSNASYGFNCGYYMDSETRISTNTAYTAGKREMSSVGEADVWWRRSPGYDSRSASVVGYNGSSDTYCRVDSDFVAIRPVLHLNLSASDLWSYAGKVSSDEKSQPTVSNSPIPVPSTTPPAGSTNSPTVAMTEAPSVSASSSASPSETPVGTLQPSGSPRSTVTNRPDGTGTLSPSATARPSVTVSPKATISASVSPATMQTFRKGQVIKDVKTKAYYKILSVTATGGKAAYLRPIDKKVKKVTIKDTVTFKGKKFKVTQIGREAFKNYKKLKNVTIGKNVSVIGKKIFANCKSLKEIILTGPMQKIPKNAFVGCPKKLKVLKKY